MRETSVAVYYQIYRDLKEQIERGVYSEKLPTEEQLCSDFKVSRSTLRRALDELKRELIIESRRGSGTYVCSRKREESIVSLTGFTEEALRDGKKATSRVIANTIVSPPEAITALFDIPSGAMVVCLKRVRYLDNEPYAIEEAFLNPAVDIRVLGVVEKNMSRDSLYTFLKNDLGILLNYAQETIEVCQMSREQARLLRLAEGALAIMRERFTYTDKDLCIEVVRSIYRGDRYKLRVTRRIQ